MLPVDTSPTSGIRFGVSVPGCAQSGIDKVRTQLNFSPSIVSDYRDWAHGEDFPYGTATRIERQSSYMLTWEPFDNKAPNIVNQPKYSLASIINGDHDAYLKRWAAQIKEWDRPLFLRFAHEMNGNWYPWCERVNGNKPGDYAMAWRYIYRLFDDMGVTKVAWVWCPNVKYTGATELIWLYPGDGYVNWVGMDGYNFGPSDKDHRWKTFNEIFDATLSTVKDITKKPIMICETGSVEFGGNKAEWIEDALMTALSISEINALIWFNHQKKQDWRIDSSPESLAAFIRGLNTRYHEA